jgi:hypothetical protein
MAQAMDGCQDRGGDASPLIVNKTRELVSLRWGGPSGPLFLFLASNCVELGALVGGNTVGGHPAITLRQSARAGEPQGQCGQLYEGRSSW